MIQSLMERSSKLPTPFHMFSPPACGREEAEEGLSLAAVLRLFADGEIEMAEAARRTGLGEATLWLYINSPLTRACVGYRNGNGNH